MITKLYLALLFSCVALVLAQDQAAAQPSGAANETISQEETTPTIIEEETPLGQTTIDEVEIEIIQEKLSLLRKRMAYLKHASGLDGVNPDCVDHEIREQGDEFTKNYARAQNATVKRNEAINKNFNMQIIRINLNSLAMSNHPYYERGYVFLPENAGDFVKYEYIHLRMKPQSTKFARASATSNSIPRYAIVALYQNNILQVFDHAKESKSIGENPYVLLTLNLTEEGVCDDVSEIIKMDTSKSPSNNYKRDNSDLRADELPYITLLMKNGFQITFQLNVIDKASALSSFKAKHRNDTRYLRADQTPNPVSQFKTQMQYNKPEIRVDKVFSVDLKELISRNLTEAQISDPAEVQELTFTFANIVTVKGRVFVMGLDHLGYISYFSTRNNRAMHFAGRYYGGDTVAPEQKFSHVQEYGTFGYFMVHQNHFMYRRHMQINMDYTNICLPGESIRTNGGIRSVMPDQGIQGLVYALPESGDEIMMFMVEIQKNQNSPGIQRQRPGNAAGGGPGRGAAGSSGNQGFKTTSMCELLGTLRFENLKGDDKIVQLQSIKGQLIIQTQSDHLYSMEALTMEQILIYPYATEITPTLQRLTGRSANPLTSNTRNLPMTTIKKSQGEINDQKGSTNLILIPHSFDQDGVARRVLYNIDYTPVKSRSGVQQELQSLVDKQEPGYQYKLASVQQAGENFNAAGEKAPKSPLWGVLNWLLGAATFCLVAYFMTMMKSNSSGGAGGGGRGWGKSKGGASGSKKGPGARAGGFGGKRR